MIKVKVREYMRERMVCTFLPPQERRTLVHFAVRQGTSVSALVRDIVLDWMDKRGIR